MAFGGVAIWLLGVQTQVAAADPIGVGLITEGAAVDASLFDWMSFQGLVRAQDDFGVVGTVYTATSPADYTPNLEKCAVEGNALCISVGFSTLEAISATAPLYPGASFAIVDTELEHYPQNLRGITFQSGEAAYIAGALAGMMTSSDIVGVIGGMEIPAVLAFTEPFQHGAVCANPEITTIITFTNNFWDQDLGASVAQDMIQEGADLIFPPAGGLGFGSILTATQSGVWGIGYDVDFYHSLFMSGTVTGSQYLLTSVVKNVDEGVYLTISDVISGTFTSGTRAYNMAEGGVGLAPYHDAESAIPGDVKHKLEWIKQGILTGWIDIAGGCPTQLFLPQLQH